MTRQALCCAVALALALVAARCQPVIPPIDPNPPPAPTIDPPAPPPVVDCETAGARLEALQCRTETGDPLWVSPLGESFADRCAKELAAGVAWRVDCLSQLDDCANVDAAVRGEWCGL
ncbi:MAG TPA: hypothetical protein VM487_09570 [Phycisphaerae bacterium]|nr:hypothetical protein [Phycisphaerae bacterium]